MNSVRKAFVIIKFHNNLSQLIAWSHFMTFNNLLFAVFCTILGSNSHEPRHDSWEDWNTAANAINSFYLCTISNLSNFFTSTHIYITIVFKLDIFIWDDNNYIIFSYSFFLTIIFHSPVQQLTTELFCFWEQSKGWMKNMSKI